ncbi:hypothetical protein ES703_38390 [subsurface metagenome]
MAGNDLTKNPMLVDTAATITWAGSGKLNIRELIWIGQANADTLVLTINKAPLTFTHIDAANGKETRPFKHPPGWVNSFVVTIIDGGNLYIFLD